MRPRRVSGQEKTVIVGEPDQRHISTDWLSLTMRMSMRRFNRLTNALIKKLESLQVAVARHFVPLQSDAAAQDLWRDGSDGSERDGSAMVARGIGRPNVQVGEFRERGICRRG
jgi:hypothetical protein